MRTYTPHQHDAQAARAALLSLARGRLRCSADERDALQAVLRAAHVGGTVTQHTICRAHDAIDRNRAPA